jgi:hypothetical protein
MKKIINCLQNDMLNYQNEINNLTEADRASVFSRNTPMLSSDGITQLDTKTYLNLNIQIPNEAISITIGEDDKWILECYDKISFNISDEVKSFILDKYGIEPVV